MKILADRNIPHIKRLFNLYNKIDFCDGRMITGKSLKDTDILLIRSVTKVNKMLLNDSYVKFIGTVTSGVDHIDQDYLKKCGIKFAYAPGSNSIAVVEYVITALFWLAQRDRFFLRDKTIGIIGIGNIGSLLHQRLCSLGIHTLLCDPPLSKKNKNKEWKTLEKIVSESHILTIHTPLTYEGDYSTWHMINYDVLDALSSNSILISTCRGEVIDNYALLNILQSGKKINVVLDVWESEPKLLLPLLSYVDLGTPHIAGYTVDGKNRGILQIYDAYCDIFNIFNKIDFSFFLPVIMNNITIRKKIDETILNQLIKLTYNISYDDYRLRNFSCIPRGFDKLREYYWSRREWSSICIKTYVDSDIEMLSNLGFTVYF